MHPKQEKTVVIIKPDGVKRGLIGEIISRLEKRGLKIIAVQMIQPTKKKIDEHYPKDKSYIENLGMKSLETYAKFGWDPIKEMGTDDPMKIGTEVRKWLLNFMTSGPVVKMVVEGIHAIEMVRKIIGKTVPSFAEMGTIRGDFSVDSADLANKGKRAVHNLIHASGDKKEAKHELQFWFSPEEVFDYKRAEEDIMF
jgi:nucleoside-diphosphate kinase